MLVALHIVMLQPDVTLESAKARATKFGASLSASQLEAALRLLSRRPRRLRLCQAGRRSEAPPMERTPGPPQQAETAIDAKQLIRTIVGRMEDEVAVEARD